MKDATSSTTISVMIDCLACLELEYASHDSRLAKNRVRFDVCSFPLNFMTSKIHHHDRNGHITRNFFHCTALISPIAKVMGLQSWERKGPIYFLTKNIILGIEKVFSMTAIVNIIDITHYFYYWKHEALGIGK